MALTAAEITPRVIQVICEQMGLREDQVTAQTSLADNLELGFDSLDRVEILMATEDEFDVSLDDDEFNKLKSVADLVAFVQSNLVD